MQATDRQLRRVEPLNALLRAELGVNPVFSWQWSESLTVTFRDREAGYTYQLDPKTGLSIPIPAYVSRTVCAPQVVDQWVFCRLMNHTQGEWIRQFNDDILWPENGRWMPMCGPLGYVSLPPWTEPDRALTFTAIRMIRENRAETEDEFMKKILDRVEAASRDADRRRRDFLENEIPRMVEAPEDTVYTFGASAPRESKGLTQ